MQATALKWVERRTSAIRRSRFAFAAGVLAVVLCIAVLAGHLSSRPLRDYMQAAINDRLKGYTADIAEVHLHPLTFSITVQGLRLRQDAHPEPPVLVLPQLDAGVHWRALLSLRLVAHFVLDEPRLYVNREQLLHEAADPRSLRSKGWQEALLAIYPLTVNELRIDDGSLTYVDAESDHPLQITRLQLLATNIRNVRAPESDYPSPIHVDAAVFEQGRLRIDGKANFLAVPHPGVDAELEVAGIPLGELRQIAAQTNLQVKGGRLAALGRVEYGPKVSDVRLRRLEIDGVAIDYVHSPETEAAEARRLEQLERTAADVADRRTGSLVVDELTIRDSTLGYVDRMRQPGYRAYLSEAHVNVRGFSNQPGADKTHLLIYGKFMGAGESWLNLWLRPRRQDPELDLSAQIESTPLKAMNDLFRTYGAFDVAAGWFSFYSQIRVENRHIDGYVKPFFTDVEVYDLRQDADKALFRQLYEGLVGGLATLLENRRGQVATEAEVRGRAKNPELSTWEVIVNFVRNAFFKAILPGFEKAVTGDDRLEGSAPSPPS